jgi:glycosyltransferase involved in cell wall biosynthesis
LKLSIVTVNLNNSAGLKLTLDSVTSQTYKDFEYIVIDGGSKDDSLSLLEKYRDQINYCISEPDSGVYQAMNKGIKKATGEYLLFLNSGDHLANEHLIAEIVSELTEIDIIYGNLFLIENEAKSWTAVYPPVLSFQHFMEGSLPHPGSFIKRSVFDRVGFYDETLKIVSDWKFFMDAICRHNVSYRHIDKTIAIFYLNGLSSLATNESKLQSEKKVILKKDYPMFIENSNELVKLRALKKNKLVTNFIKVANIFGKLKDYQSL